MDDLNEFLSFEIICESHYQSRCLFFFISPWIFPVGHVLPIPSATDKDGEDDELVYWLEKSSKIPFELVSFGSNQIGMHRLCLNPNLICILYFSFKRNRTFRS
jgi:hypothetical protein